MFSSENLNKSMLNNALSFEKICKKSLSIRLRRLGALHPYPCDLTVTHTLPTVLLQNVLILSPIKINSDQQNLGRF